MKAVPCPVSPESLRDLILNQKLTEAQVAAMLPGGTIKRVQSWKQRYGIETPHRWERYALPPIEGRLKSLLVGSMLGDGRLARRVHATHYIERHCGEQRAYLEWKASQWGAWATGIKEIPDKRGFSLFGFNTLAHADLNAWQELFYADQNHGWKRQLPAVIDHVDEFALAIWYLDDGWVGWWPGISFGADEASRLVAFSIFEKFNLKPRWVQLQPDNATNGQFLLDQEEMAEHFLELVLPHIPDCMAYKRGPFGFQGSHYQIRQKLTPEALQDMADRSTPLREMARVFGVGGATIDRWLIKCKIDHPQRGKVGRPSGDTHGGH